MLSAAYLIFFERTKSFDKIFGGKSWVIYNLIIIHIIAQSIDFKMIYESIIGTNKNKCTSSFFGAFVGKKSSLVDNLLKDL